MKYKFWVHMGIVVFAGFQTQARAAGILGSAQSFAVLGGSAVTNTGPTTITGNLGVAPAPLSSITGSGSITFTGSSGIQSTTVSQTAQNDVATAYNGLAAMQPTQVMNTMELGGLTLTPGVYYFSSSADLTGTLTLNAEGYNNAYWVFQIGSTLTTATGTPTTPAAIVQEINVGSNSGANDGVFWQVGSSATLGTYTAFEGNILAKTSITLTTGATIANGRALAETGAVTMDTNTISNICPPPNNGPGFSGGLEYASNGTTIVPIGLSAVPEPASFALLGTGLLGLIAIGKKRFS